MDTADSIITIVKERLGDQFNDYLIPPPVFTTMEGEHLDYDLESGFLVTRFPVKTDYLNPYGAMQGGMIAAAVDNTVGPLSVMIAPPNVTRRLEMKYSRPVMPDLEFIVVRATLVERKGPQLVFIAEVRSSQDELLARARAVHWVLDN